MDFSPLSLLAGTNQEDHMPDRDYSSADTTAARAVVPKPSADEFNALLYSQYLDLKASNPDCLLLVRLGASYEVFGYDADRVACVLGLSLGEATAGVCHCRFPFRDKDSQVGKLILDNIAVAIAERIDKPAAARNGGLGRHVVVSVHRPGGYDPFQIPAPPISEDDLAEGLSDPIGALWAERVPLAVEHERLTDTALYADKERARLFPEVPPIAFSMPVDLQYVLLPGAEKVEKSDADGRRQSYITAAGFERLIALLPSISERDCLDKLLSRARAGLLEMRAYDAACEAAERKTGVQDLDARAAAAADRLWDIDDAIMAAPARTVADLRVKARVMKSRCPDSDPHVDYVHALVHSILIFNR